VESRTDLIKRKIIMNNTTTNTKLLDVISQANEAQVDSVWAILKYKEIGIYRKIACMCEVLGLDLQEILNEGGCEVDLACFNLLLSTSGFKLLFSTHSMQQKFNSLFLQCEKCTSRHAQLLISTDR